jgi:integrase
VFGRRRRSGVTWVAIAIPDSCSRSLAKAQTRRPRFRCGRAATLPGGVGVASADGGKLNTSALYTRAERAWDAKKLTHIRLHESRHTASSWLRAAGIDLKTRSVLMGHASTATTDKGTARSPTPATHIYSQAKSKRPASDSRRT